MRSANVRVSRRGASSTRVRVRVGRSESFENVGQTGRPTDRPRLTRSHCLTPCYSAFLGRSVGSVGRSEVGQVPPSKGDDTDPPSDRPVTCSAGNEPQKRRPSTTERHTVSRLELTADDERTHPRRLAFKTGAREPVRPRQSSPGGRRVADVVLVTGREERGAHPSHSSRSLASARDQRLSSPVRRAQIDGEPRPRRVPPHASPSNRMGRPSTSEGGQCS